MKKSILAVLIIGLSNPVFSNVIDKEPVFENIENIKLKEENGYYVLSGKDIIHKAYGTNFDLSFKLREDSKYTYEIQEGIFIDKNGESLFSGVIDKSSLNQSKDMIDIINYSKVFNMNSRSNMTSNLLLKRFNINTDSKIINEVLSFTKTDNKLYINILRIDIENYLYLDFKGVINYQTGKIENGTLTYNFSDEVFNAVNQKYEIKKINQTDLILEDHYIIDVFKNIFDK